MNALVSFSTQIATNRFSAANVQKSRPARTSASVRFAHAKTEADMITVGTSFPGLLSVQARIRDEAQGRQLLVGMPVMAPEFGVDPSMIIEVDNPSLSHNLTQSHLTKIFNAVSERLRAQVKQLPDHLKSNSAVLNWLEWQALFGEDTESVSSQLDVITQDNHRTVKAGLLKAKDILLQEQQNVFSYYIQAGLQENNMLPALDCIRFQILNNLHSRVQGTFHNLPDIKAVSKELFTFVKPDLLTSDLQRFTTPPDNNFYQTLGLSQEVLALIVKLNKLAKLDAGLVSGYFGSSPANNVARKVLPAAQAALRDTLLQAMHVSEQPNTSDPDAAIKLVIQYLAEASTPLPFFKKALQYIGLYRPYSNPLTDYRLMDAVLKTAEAINQLICRTEPGNTDLMRRAYEIFDRNVLHLLEDPRYENVPSVQQALALIQELRLAQLGETESTDFMGRWSSDDVVVSPTT